MDRRTFLGVLLAAALKPSWAAQAGQTGLYPWLKVAEHVQAQLYADQKLLADVDFSARSEGMVRDPIARFTFPRGAARLRLVGQVSRKGQKRKFDASWPVHDVAHWTESLYGTGPLSQRLMRFHLTAGEHSTMTFEAPDPAPEYLPRALRELYQSYFIRVGDSRFLSAVEIDRVSSIISESWNYKDLDALVPEPVRRRYERSFMVFVEVGDGLGALAWDPEEQIWFWLHEDSLVEPDLLVGRSDEEAILTVFQRFAVLGVLESLELSETMIDSSHPTGLLQLHFNNEGPQLMFRSYEERYAIW